LTRSNEELEQFAYVASHDLKAPLRGIENLITWIEEDLAGTLSGDTKTNMDLLRNRVQRLDSLLNDLLEYSRAGRRKDAAEQVDTRALIEDIIELIGPPDGFVVTAAGPFPQLVTVRAPLRQVFQNLIGNAIKHHHDPANGRVRVEALRHDGGTEFILADNGPGIPERFHARVFGMFQTLRPRDEVEGSGMGLAIVKKIVESHGGKIWLKTGDESGLFVHFIWPDQADWNDNHE
jgi:signal transduction histidine kinase